ncbi:KDO2-lipid IV(A) lauroyltransferase [Pseudooceanicola nitratireducens]|jgi:KDO2-lipid IV(A) lauroyltransferase|uniref:KDO2-lipid IV(A) lauroyltransferase n=2 Tax=Pseudooceanicola nitratireducens TaxID=517719 RepID=A0A1I1L427_9RHOB|nr:lysophospholipid acyltransferase family protein [Pseudooceanicola nitratireducens]SEJ40252.1 KDO2-lipid IV(A) lauroyltransferase [Pseudooceanicola nitratireducens]SFC67741.1 KDO2-lipid IV(A) lauroyltransferase [Pseudooceanicola nitratireducens]
MTPSELPLRQRIGQYLTHLALTAIVRLALALPYGWRVPLTGWLVSRVVAPLAGWPRRIRSNLGQVWPDLAPSEVARLTRAVPDNAGRTLIEIYSGPAFKDRLRAITPEGPGWEALKAAKAEGRPIFLISGHFGNYDAIRARVAMEYGQVGGLYRPLNNVYFNRHYVKAIAQTSEPVFPRGRRGLAEMMKFTRAGNIMAMLTDQHFHHGAALRFFGHTAYTALSVPEMALKLNAVVIPCYGIRQKDGLSFRLVFEDPVPHSTPEQMGQHLNDSLEARVRNNPGQWLWIHRRWKEIAGREEAADLSPDVDAEA